MVQSSQVKVASTCCLDTKLSHFKDLSNVTPRAVKDLDHVRLLSAIVMHCIYHVMYCYVLYISCYVLYILYI